MAAIPPTVVTLAGPQPLDPATIRAGIITDVASTNPGYTANLPGSLVEDVVSTDVASVAQCDSARVETMNSLTPYGANAFMLNQLGQMLGIVPGVTSNTSVGLVFTGPPGYPIAASFVVSDGTYQYVVQDGGVIQSSGFSAVLTAVSPTPGTWVVPANTVTQLGTSVPVTISLSVTNPEAGIPGAAAETEWDFRARVLQANLAPAVGTGRALKTALLNVPGTVQRLVSFRPSIAGPVDNYEVIVGGGDDFAVANAIQTSMFDFLDLVGSTMTVTGISQANPAVVTTSLKHGYVATNVVTLNGVVGMTALNGIPFTVQSVIGLFQFSIGVNTTAFPAYVSGGVVTPNPRNFSIPINDYPDTYVITFVRPPQQAVAVTATWNTTLINFTGAGAVAQLAAPALVDYINSVAVGAPMLVNAMEQVFAAAVSNVLPSQYLTRLVFAVSVDGIGISPISGTFEIMGDPESFFFADTGDVNVVQG